MTDLQGCPVHMNRCTTIAASLFLLAACSSGERAEPSPFTTAAPPPAPMTSGSTSTGSTAAEFTTGLDTSSTSSGETSTSTGAAVDMGASTSSGDTSSFTSSSGGETSSSTSGAPLPSCGDGFVDEGEECDEGSGNADDSLCTLACAFAACGDGLVFPDEEFCDDGNALNTDACINTCGVALCGDGFVFVGAEQCDDANLIDDDTCSDACVKATCDDGAKNGEETALDCGGLTCKACSIPGLVINEVDYDTPNDAADLVEFIELLNTTEASINLAGHSVMLVNGSNNTVYATIALDGAGSIAAGQYLAIATPAVNVPPTALKVAGKAGTIQNGSPDGIALVNTAKGVVLDAVSYEGGMLAVTLPGIGLVSLVEGVQTNVEDNNLSPRSIGRLPDGYDANNAATDWAQFEAQTPGAPNM